MATKDKSQQIINDIQLALAGESPMVNATLKRGSRKLLEKCTDLVDRLLRDYKDRLMDELGNPFVYTNGKAIVFPEGTRFLSRYNANTVIVVEDKPRLRTVRFENFHHRENYQRSTYLLAFPYVLYVMTFGKNPGTEYSFAGLHVAYRNEPLMSTDDELYKCNLPNITDTSVCLGWGANGNNLAKLSDNCITHFWSSAFNSDGIANWEHVAKKEERLGSPEAWEKASKADPLFVLTVKWQKAGLQLRKLVRQATAADDDDVNEFLARLVSGTLANCISRLPVSEVEKTLSAALRDALTIAVKEAVLKSAK